MTVTNCDMCSNELISKNGNVIHVMQTMVQYRGEHFCTKCYNKIRNLTLAKKQEKIYVSKV